MRWTLGFLSTVALVAADADRAALAPDVMRFSSKVRVLLIGGAAEPPASVRSRVSVSSVPAAAAANWRANEWIAPDLVVEFKPCALVPRLTDVPGRCVTVLSAADWRAIAQTPPSPLRVAMERRAKRTPTEIAVELAKVYGLAIQDTVYTETVSLIGQLRLGRRAEVERILDPFVDRGTLPAKPTPSHFSGHLIFGELANRDRVRAAAELALGPESIYNEMSDGVFMGCPILGQAGRLTGEAKYFDAAVRLYRSMAKLDRRADNLWRHSPLCDAAWGRGNAFPALGLAWLLGDLPDWHAARPELLAAFRQHIAALAKHQDATGMWHQVIDEPSSYAEFSATAMILVAMKRGIRAGWLERGQYQPRIERAWHALQMRIGSDGSIAGVCTGTGKQKTLEDYFAREAIFGRDARGGAMALLAATEMMR